MTSFDEKPTPILSLENEVVLNSTVGVPGSMSTRRFGNLIASLERRRHGYRFADLILTR